MSGSSEEKALNMRLKEDLAACQSKSIKIKTDIDTLVALTETSKSRVAQCSTAKEAIDVFLASTKTIITDTTKKEASAKTALIESIALSSKSLDECKKNKVNIGKELATCKSENKSITAQIDSAQADLNKIIETFNISQAALSDAQKALAEKSANI
jgi:chromosome segregation ATPase